jgi:indolepyruvate ferredoxin oxidoreductase beta subunit
MQNGYVTPDRTTLVASRHRVYATSEKIAMGDGRFPAEAIERAAASLARRLVLDDLSALADRAGTIINAVLFGAMAGSGALPFPREACEQAIRAEGKGAEASVRGFAEGYALAQRVVGRAGTATITTDAAGTGAVATAADARGGVATRAAANDAATTARARGGIGTTNVAATPAIGASHAALPASLRTALDALPASLRDIAELGTRRALDYQDDRYAARYLDRVRTLAVAESAAANSGAEDATSRSAGDAAVAREAARELALWMCFEDVIRVADLKSRVSRLGRLRTEVRARDAEPVEVIDYLKPGTEEFAALLPPALAQRLRAWGLRDGRDRLSRPIHLRTTSITGYASLRALAALRRWRPRTSRFLAEQAAIDRWIADVAAALARSRPLAFAIARLPRLLKGYGDTHVRGRASFDRIVSALVDGGPDLDDESRARAIGEAFDAALADPTGRRLEGVTGGCAEPTQSGRRVVWMKPGRS